MPTRDLNNFVGQAPLISRIQVSLQAAFVQGRRNPHILLHGPYGIGKRTLASAIAATIGRHTFDMPASTLTSPQLLACVTKCEARDILTVADIERVPVAIIPTLVSAMYSQQVHIPLDSGIHARAMTIDLQPFSVIATTTNLAAIMPELRSAFDLIEHLAFYAASELEALLQHHCKLVGVPIEPEALSELSLRARGLPRVAHDLLKATLDYAATLRASRVARDDVIAAMRLAQVDSLGLDALARRYLALIVDVHDGGPVGIDTLAAALGIHVATLIDEVEPILMQTGLISKDTTGRRITEQGRRHLLQVRS